MARLLAKVCHLRVVVGGGLLAEKRAGRGMSGTGGSMKGSGRVKQLFCHTLGIDNVDIEASQIQLC